MLKSKGFTLIELILVLALITAGALIAGVIIHFIAKFW